MNDTCPHAAILCKLHDCARCQHADDMGACPYSHAQDARTASPTFAEALEIFSRRKDVADEYRKFVVSAVSADIRIVGLDGSCRTDMMTRGRFKTLIGLLEARGYEQVTVKGHLQAFGSLGAERLEQAYEAMGLEMPTFGIPSYRVDSARPQEVRERDIAKLKKLMGAWAERGDAEMYKAAWFGINAGMRWGDVCRITWSVFKQTVDGMLIEYVPHKTARSSGAKVSFRVDPEAYLDIEPYVGAKDEYVLKRSTWNRRKGAAADGEFSGLHRSLHNRINAAIRACGIGTGKNEKRFHALRKRFDTRNAQAYGERQAAAMAGHSVEVARRNYIGTAGGRWS